MIDEILDFWSMLRIYWGVWDDFFLVFLKDYLPGILLLIALLLTYIHWLRGKSFKYSLAVPIVLLYWSLSALYDYFRAWVLHDIRIEGDLFFIIFCFLVTLFLTFCLAFFILAMVKSDFHHAALLILVPILLNMLCGVVQMILYILIPMFSFSALIDLFTTVITRLAWLLFCAGWYMKQKECTA